MTYDVAIVGGGLAGINAARLLGDSGMIVAIFESSDALGGKLRTDTDADGFIYDRGFQVFFDAYDELPRNLEEPLADWGPLQYGAGAEVVSLGIVGRSSPLNSLLSKAVTWPDLLLMLKLNRFSRGWESFNGMNTAREFITEFGFSTQAIEKFLSPFLGGIFLDRELRISARQFLKTWHYLSRGKTLTFENGIAAIPSYLAHRLQADVHLNTKITKVHRDGEMNGLESDQGRVRAKTIILANGPSLVESEPVSQAYKQSICLYFASDRPVSRNRYIILNPTEDALVNQLVPVSIVNPNAAPKGKHLCSATILGDRHETDEQLAEMAIREMNMWGMNLPPLEFKRAYRIKEAQLLQEPGFEDKVPAIATHLPGVFLAGEFTISSSINDALKSGRLAAEAVRAYLGGQ